MPMVNSRSGGFYTDRIGTTDNGFPVYLYFDPAAAAFRPTVVPPAGNPYYASAETRILHETAQVSPGMPDFPLKVALSGNPNNLRCLSAFSNLGLGRRESV